MARISYRWHLKIKKKYWYNDKTSSLWSGQLHMFNFTWLMCLPFSWLPWISQFQNHSVANAHWSKCAVAGGTLKIYFKRSFYIAKYLCSTSKATVQLLQHAGNSKTELHYASHAVETEMKLQPCYRIFPLCMSSYNAGKVFELSHSTTNHNL